jgi:HK97 family phage major capsid protein
MFTYLQRLVNERTSLTTSITAMADKAADEDRDLTTEERESIARLQTRCAEIDTQLTDGQAQVESQRGYADLLGRIKRNEEASGAVQTRGAISVVERTTALARPGDSFVTSEAFTEYRGMGVGARHEVEGLLETRAAIMTSDLSIPPFRWSGPPEPSVTSPLLDAVAHVPVSSGVVDWVSTGPDPVAGVVAEGAIKPEAAITLTPHSETLDTLAHWVQITRQALEDAAYIRGLVETKLRRGLMLKAEADLAVAILGDATIPAASSTDLLGAIRVGIASVQEAGFGPDVLLLNPADWADLDLAVMADTTNGPVRGQTFWGLRAIASSKITAGTAYVADAKTAFTLFDRGVSNVFLTDSHASLFISNILVILAETRVKSAVTDSTAAAKCTVVP